MIVYDYKIKRSFRKKALLINPYIYDTQYWAEWSQPDGLLRIASLLKRKGYFTYLIDCLETNQNRKVNKKTIGKRRVDDIDLKIYHFGLGKKDFIKMVENFQNEYGCPDEIFVTSIMTFWWESTRDVIDILREIFPDQEKTKILLGGIYPTLAPEHAEKNTIADIIVKNEIYEASNLPLDLSLYPNKKHKYAIIKGKRGCPYNCVYCAQRTLNNGRNGEIVRCQEPKAIVDEIEFYLSEYYIKDFAFYEDSIFYRSKENLEKVLDEILNRKLKLNLYAPEGFEPREISRHPEIIYKMKEAGWKKIHLGLESSIVEINKSWNRTHTTTEDFEKAVSEIEKAGFKLRGPQVNAFILYGMPDEKIEDVVETILYGSHIVGSLIPMLFTPVPQTQIYNKYLQFLKNQKFNLHDLNGKFLPFLKLNGYRASDYFDLQRLMFSLNIQYRSASFDPLSNNTVSKKYREKLTG
ncbi:MAG: radical SAM protein [Candidatus Lokiarchaeota archaeon]|nr:radical SAM protein [Candidatus Lokiarchaeota archaeon]